MGNLTNKKVVLPKIIVFTLLLVVDGGKFRRKKERVLAVRQVAYNKNP